MRHRAHRTDWGADPLGGWTWAVLDGAMWFIAIYGAFWLRMDFELRPVLRLSTLVFASVAVIVHVYNGVLVGPYQVGHQRGSFEETLDLSRGVVVTGLALELAAFGIGSVAMPRSVPAMASVLALAGMFALRYLLRSWRNRRASTMTSARRVIVFGAGDAGRQLIRNMIRDETSGYLPVALLDDDHRKRHLHIDGVPVCGTRHDVAPVARRYTATALVVALPHIDAALVRELTHQAISAGLDIQVLPPLRDIIGGQPTSRDLRDVNVQDLLGRRPISLDTTAIGEQVAGRSVLVTGAGGSIGSELCRQISVFAPAKLYLLDRDESGLLDTQMSLTGQGLLQEDEVILGSIRDLDSMRAVFAMSRPDIVFHAAALKHLPLLESFPLEAWKTNVLGTLNVLTAAAEVGVGTFVNISTDKAADPTSVLGYSKRVAERLTADFARTQPGRYVSVRFGNVLGSRGSVLHTFTAQILRGGPVTITHPDVERFFMLIPEACQLVLEASAIGLDGQVMVLDMGTQVKIAEVAHTLIRMSGRRDIEIAFTGLRPGEKLSEELFARNEQQEPSRNPLINCVEVPKLDGVDLRGLAFSSGESVVAWMRRHAATSLRASV